MENTLQDLYTMFDNCPKYIFAAVLLDRFYNRHAAWRSAKVEEIYRGKWNSYMSILENELIYDAHGESIRYKKTIYFIQAFMLLANTHYESFANSIGPWLTEAFPHYNWYCGVNVDIENLQNIRKYSMQDEHAGK